MTKEEEGGWPEENREHIFISHRVRNSAYSDNPFLRSSRRKREPALRRIYMRNRVPNGKFSFSLGLYFSSSSSRARRIHPSNFITAYLVFCAISHVHIHERPPARAREATRRDIGFFSGENPEIPDSFRPLTLSFVRLRVKSFICFPGREF